MNSVINASFIHSAPWAVGIYTAIVAALCLVYSLLRFDAACEDGLTPSTRAKMIMQALGLLMVVPVSFLVTFVF